MPDARWWSAGENGEVVCSLCFRNCTIPPGSANSPGRGVCRVRENHDGRLISPYLGHFVSAAIDPIEKKPLYHWRPGSRIYSVGGLGCTMHCQFCQNHEIAQPRKLPGPTFFPVERLAAECKRHGIDSVAYTYNEPSLQAEYILAAAPLLKTAGIATVMVTNGMLSSEVAQALLPHVAAANIDVKTFSGSNYAKLGGSLEQVQRNLALWAEAGVHVEATCLVVPGVSDDEGAFTALTEWLSAINPAIPLHISRYFPRHKFTAPPTATNLMQHFAAIAKKRLTHVYLGNVR